MAVAYARRRVAGFFHLWMKHKVTLLGLPSGVPMTAVDLMKGHVATLSSFDESRWSMIWQLTTGHRDRPLDVGSP